MVKAGVLEWYGHEGRDVIHECKLYRSGERQRGVESGMTRFKVGM